ncbi:MAG: 3-oxoacyl-ACP reductase FabG [Saprospiraceae bacterium]|nr:3-oxoacyl-ACP reductase FabG [Saprospiraceae bacterium]
MGKYAFVTGGSRGIGRAICLQLASDGYNVIATYKNNDAAAKELIQLLDKIGGQHQLLKYDVSDPAMTEKTLSEWRKANPDIDVHILVNNSGIRKDNLMIFMPDQDWKTVIDTNLNSFFYTTKFFVQLMAKKRAGRIINIVSLSGLKGMPGQTNYSASKAGVIGATKALAQEMAKRNITVNAIAPGFIKTDMTDNLNEDELRQLIPMNRFGSAEEVAYLASFLASEKASYITGQVISINGGLYT